MLRNTFNNYVNIFGDSKQFLSGVYIEYIFNMKNQLCHLHLDQYLFNKNFI